MICIHLIKAILIPTIPSVCFYHVCFYHLMINETNVNICSYSMATFHKRMHIEKSKRFLSKFAIGILKLEK